MHYSEESNLLNDISSLTDPPKSSSTMDTLPNPLHDRQQATSAPLDVGPTEDLIHQMTAEQVCWTATS